MATPYPFSSGATLLASQMNSLSELPIVSITSASTAVATHSYSRIIANGTAVTYTIPNNVFQAGQVIEFHNINSVAATIAAGAGVTLNAATAVTVEQYQSATIYATSASSFILFESHVRPGLELISSTTIGSAVTTVAVSNVFSSTYDNYRIIISGGAASSSDAGLIMTLGAKVTGYKSVLYYQDYSNGAITILGAVTTYMFTGRTGTNGHSAMIDVIAPNLAKDTTVIAHGASPTFNTWAINNTNDTTSYTGFTLDRSGGTLTGGTIKVYGYRN